MYLIVSVLFHRPMRLTKSLRVGCLLDEKKMGIDRETPARFINIVMDDTPKHLKAMREQADADDQNSALEEGEPKKLCFSSFERNSVVEEYYFDEDTGENLPALNYMGYLNSDSGKIFVSFSLPLSDTVLLDILQHSIKRLGKLKTAMEALK